MPASDDMLDPLPRMESADPRTGSGQEPGKPPDPEKSRFESWFVEKFSTRPSQKSAGRLADAVSVAKQELHRAQSLLERCTEWDQRYDAALQAWRERERLRETEGK